MEDPVMTVEAAKHHHQYKEVGKEEQVQYLMQWQKWQLRQHLRHLQFGLRQQYLQTRGEKKLRLPKFKGLDEPKLTVKAWLKAVKNE
ncbi:hypothetical protein PHMEG_00015958 [Phytophthora megakarya]|uniref:Uncharacterized protein n=1 Tax=Phytophthora megakarya TaxID=4795 RepID=A0A225W241_9STRA|nr:hypothetical protein PHMEG_00015958 [Phytophthora megakarya]